MQRTRAMTKDTAIAALTLAVAAAAGPVSAQGDLGSGGDLRDVPDEFASYAFVCPDGGYESGCDAMDIEAAVDLSGVAPADFSTRCLYHTDADCDVMASGQINRPDAAPALHWQLLGLHPSDGPFAQMMVMAEFDDGLPAVLLSQQVDGYFLAPTARHDFDGRFLIHVPARNRGLGNADLMLFTSGQGWNWTSAEMIMQQVDRLLPEGFAITSPVSFDFYEGVALGLVRRDTDSGCCATGGVAIVSLTQSDNSLAVSHLTFNETQPVGASRRSWPMEVQQMPKDDAE